MTNYSKFLELQSGSARTVDLSNNSNILTLGGAGLQFNGSTSGLLTIAANATTSTYSLTWPAAQAASSGYVLTNDGTGVLSWSAPAATGANTALSNLASVAINTSLLPGVDDSISLGSTSLRWANVYAFNQVLYGSSSGAITQEANSTTTPYTIKWPAAQAGGSNYVLANDGSGNLTWIASSTGSVTSVAFADDSTTPIYSVSGSPVTSTGTLAITLMTQSANMVFAGPSTGPAAQPTFRSLVVADFPTVNSDTGSFGSSTSIPSFTVNAQGLITAASGNAVIAPAGTLSGTTLNSTVVTSSLTSLGTQSQALNMGNNQINNLASPSVSTDAATKGYVDAAISGLTWKGPVQAYAASNVPLTGSTPLVIDGHTVANNDLLLLGNQTTASQNGEYTAAVTGGSYTLTANGQPTAAGDAWLVLDGTVYANSAFVATAAVPAATFVEFAGPTAYTFTAPLMLSGNTVSITQASGSSNGYLSSTDWNTFNNKQPAGNYITALTGDVTASGPGSAVATLATVNSNVGSFTYASITVNAKGLVTAASSGTAPVTSISISSSNGFAGTSSGGSTPSLTIETTINSPVLAGNGTAISAATTTGTGSTVVLSASPALTGTTTAANVTLSGNLVAPILQVTATYNGAATLTAHTTYALRWGIPANSETAADLYLADWSTTSFDEFWVIGLYNNTTATTTGTSITITTKGEFTLGSSDTTFGSTDQGKPVWLGSSGAFTPNSTFSPSSGDANEKLGIVMNSTTIWVDCQAMGVS